MKLRTITVLATCIACGMAAGCETADNSNSNLRNTNSNRAVVVNATATPASNTNASNISREEYDKRRAEYEKDKGSSTIGQGINDSWLWFKTRAALAAADDLRDSTINVDCVNDVITLKGTVANASQKTRAEAVAKGIDGVKSVKNELKVQANDSLTNHVVNGNSSATNRKK